MSSSTFLTSIIAQKRIHILHRRLPFLYRGLMLPDAHCKLGWCLRTGKRKSEISTARHGEICGSACKWHRQTMCRVVKQCDAPPGAVSYQFLDRSTRADVPNKRSCTDAERPRILLPRGCRVVEGAV